MFVILMILLLNTKTEGNLGSRDTPLPNAKAQTTCFYPNGNVDRAAFCGHNFGEYFTGCILYTNTEPDHTPYLTIRKPKP